MPDKLNMFKNMAVPPMLLRAFLLRGAGTGCLALLIALAGVYLAKALQISNFLSAVVTFAIFGFCYGSALVFPLGRIGRPPYLWLPVLGLIWSASCMAGVAPLFFTNGIPAKMIVMTFASFSVCGAAGGAATLRIVAKAYGLTQRDYIPCVLIWSFFFGIGAIAANGLGVLLAKWMPEPVCWSIGFLSMAVITGSGGGFATGLFTITKKVEHPAPSVSGGPGYHYPLVFFLLALPFYLNDFASIYISDWRWWLFIDYTSVKLFPAVILFWVLFSGIMKPADFGFSRQSLSGFIATLLFGVFAGMFVEQNGYLIANRLPGFGTLGGMPAITDPTWNWIDLTVGLLLVGFFEELVFRAYLYSVIRRYTGQAAVIVLASAVAFGCIHWSGGFHKILVTGIVGGIFMMIYLRTRSIPGLMLVHFFVNFLDFSGFLPKEIIRYL